MQQRVFRYLKVLLGCLVIQASFLMPALAAWTINSVDVDTAYDDSLGLANIVWIKADLSSDGAAETDIDLWTTLQTTIDSVEKSIVKNGGLLLFIVYRQGTDAPDNDFLLTVYNGLGARIFAETIDYDETGSDSIVGGIYAGDLTKGIAQPVAGGLKLDVGDIGASGDDILLWFGVYVGN